MEIDAQKKYKCEVNLDGDDAPAKVLRGIGRSKPVPMYLNVCATRRRLG